MPLSKHDLLYTVSCSIMMFSLEKWVSLKLSISVWGCTAVGICGHPKDNFITNLHMGTNELGNSPFISDL